MKTRITFGCFLMGWALLAGIATRVIGADIEDGFKSLFNGRDLNGWDGDPQFWSVKDGVINGQTTADNPAKGNTFLIWRDGPLDDFELRVSYRIVGTNPEKWGNSGIQYRSKDCGQWVVGGYQADIETGPTYTGILYEERVRGILAQRGEKVVIDADGKVRVVGSAGNSAAIQAALKEEGWNDYEIIAQGNHIVQRINGLVTVDVTDEQPGKRARSGILALQLHAGQPMQVQFKDVRLKRLKLADAKKIVLVAGAPSHGAGDHEHSAGVALWKHCLDPLPGVVTAAYIHCNGWPKDPSAFDNADAVVFYTDGAEGNPLIQGNRLSVLAELMKKGIGLGCVHFAVEVPKDNGGRQLTDWVGGYFELYWSVNPTWTADFKEFPEHPVTRGVKPFEMTDEWYYHMHFRDNLRGVTPILSAVPPEDTRGKPGVNDPRGGNPEVQKHAGEAEHLMWVCERPDGGRGLGYTGGHFHKNWLEENNRRVLLNGLLWIAKADVPPAGVQSSVTADDLRYNLDAKDNQTFIPAPWLDTSMK